MSCWQELGDQSKAAKPLRRRALLIVGQWTPKLHERDRPAVYHAVLQMLGDQDAALQLAAVATLQSLVDDWDFREDQFVDIAGPAFAALMPVLQSAEDYDAQLQARAACPCRLALILLGMSHRGQTTDL